MEIRKTSIDLSGEYVYMIHKFNIAYYLTLKHG